MVEGGTRGEEGSDEGGGGGGGGGLTAKGGRLKRAREEGSIQREGHHTGWVSNGPLLGTSAVAGVLITV